MSDTKLPASWPFNILPVLDHPGFFMLRHYLGVIAYLHEVDGAPVITPVGTFEETMKASEIFT